MHRWPVPPTEEERIQGGSTREMRVAFWPRNSNYETNPPSENTRHLTDFHGTLELARDFGLERREIAAVYAPRVDNRGGALIVARGSLRRRGPFMTSGPDPLGSSMAIPLTPSLPNP